MQPHANVWRNNQTVPKEKNNNRKQTSSLKQTSRYQKARKEIKTG